MKKTLLCLALVTAIALVVVYTLSVWRIIHSQLLFFPCSPTSPVPSSSLLNVGQDGSVMMYESALATLRCLTTPNCFPSSQCRVGVPKKIQRRKYWEEHSLCTDEILQKKDCLVYSFGIHVSSEWEEKMAKLLHCEVHAFDPTMNHPKNLAPGVTFHKLGLQAEGTDMSSTHASEYDVIDPTLLLTLGEIMQQLGHVGRKLDVLALDCEGCEWGVLKQMACSGASTVVDQLFVEFHFQKDLGLATPHDVIHAAQGIQCLWHHRWHIVAIENSGSWWKNWDYTDGIGQVIHDEGFLLYLSMQRFPLDEPMPSDRLLEAANATRAYFAVEDMYTKQYKTEKSEKWPVDAQEILRQRQVESNQAAGRKQQIQRPTKVEFDKFSRLEET